MLAALCAVLAACGADDPVDADLIVSADRLFDGRELIENGAVAIKGDEVVAAGAADDLDATAPRRMNLDDATILPGLVDLHGHTLGENQRFSAVTTVRDVGASEASIAVFRQEPAWPRVVYAGPLITVPDGYPIPVHGSDLAAVVRSPDEGRETVRRLHELGAGVIKVGLEKGGRGLPILSRPELDAIVEEAHDRDLLVTAHVSHVDQARMALEAGVDDLAHMPCVGDDAELMADLADAGVEIVGTLDVISEFGFCPVLDYAADYVRAGGTLLYGSDSGNPGVPPGVDVEELRLMVRAGLSPQEALTNATSRAAEQLDIEGLGTLREGAPADLVAVDGNPFADLERLDVPRLLIVRGRIVVRNGAIVD